MDSQRDVLILKLNQNKNDKNKMRLSTSYCIRNNQQVGVKYDVVQI